MRLICFWCCALLAADALREDDFYTPQTFAQVRGAMFQPADSPGASSQRNADIVEPHRQRQLFRPGAGGGAGDVSAQGTVVPTWKAGPAPPAPAYDGYSNYRGGEERRPEPWRLPYGLSKEQQATILHHKQSLSSEGAFRFEYASDNGLSAGEVIEPDGSRVGAYQYKDPSGQLVKLKYRAGKEGFQILEGSHLPKSPEPVAPPAASDYNTAAYEQQRRQFELQQNYNQQREQRPPWHSQEGRGGEEGSAAGGAGGGAGGQYYSGWRPEGRDDGQYRDNDIDEASRGPHSFGEGYAFAFKG